MVFHLNPNQRWSLTGDLVTGYDVCRHLVAMAEKGHLAYQADWSELFAGASVNDVFEVTVDFRRTHVHPDAMLQTPLVPWNTIDLDSAEIPGNGPYSLYFGDDTPENEVHFRANDSYFATGAKQPKEIVERFFADGRQAVDALRRGKVAALDRVNPWDVPALKASQQFVTEPYAVPCVHCLIPHSKKSILSRRAFRRALVYGIKRQEILDELLRGAESQQNQVISGPFPRGQDYDDPLGYAFNEQIRPRPYNPRLAMTLAHLALRQESAMSKKRGEGELKDIPPLVLAHPPHDVARVACRAIQEQLKPLGIEVTLTELAPRVWGQPEQDYDLRYAELAMWDPVVDARRLLGPNGLLGRTSAYMSLALRQLDQANDWKRAREALWDIHRLAHEDVSIIPLWQLADYFAYNKALRGIGAKPVTLYQSIETWQSPPAILPESP